MAKDKELPVETSKETEDVSGKPILVIRVKDDLTNCVELSPEGYERMQTELKNCKGNTTETLKSVWEGYRIATSEEVKAYKAKGHSQEKLTTIFSNE